MNILQIDALDNACVASSEFFNTIGAKPSFDGQLLNCSFPLSTALRTVKLLGLAHSVVEDADGGLDRWLVSGGPAKGQVLSRLRLD